jgi:hypothetical protein
MTVQMLLLPLFAQVLLTFAVLGVLVVRRFGAVSRGEVTRRDGDAVWPRPGVLAGRGYASQFELPVLFYVLTGLVLATNAGGIVFVVLAWIFVVLRIVHAVILVGDGPTRPRFLAFAAGAVVLGAMWVLFMLRILLAPVAA